jgi:hypothetical protein
MTTEVALVDQAVFGSIEDRPPFFQLTHSIRGLLSMVLSHAPLIEELAAPHGVPKMNFPIVTGINVAQGGGHTPLGHHSVSFAQQRFGKQPGVQALRGRLNGRADTGSAGSHHENVMLDCL